MTKLLAAFAVALVLAGIVLPGNAEARCHWTRHGWSCTQRAHAYTASGWYYGGFNDPAFGYYRGRGHVPYAAYGAASHLGPDPGGGFCHMGRPAWACSTD